MTDIITYCQLLEEKVTGKFHAPVITVRHGVLLKNINALLYEEIKEKCYFFSRISIAQSVFTNCKHEQL
jgi:hypothetical protein